MNISLREFQHHATKYIKELAKEEIILTQYNLPIAKVVSVDTKSTVTPPSDSPLIEEEDKWVTRCEYQACRKDAIGNFSIETHSTDTGDQTITKNLCKLHKYHATKEGTVTQI